MGRGGCAVTTRRSASPLDPHGDWQSLEVLFRAFPSTQRQRRAWRTTTIRVDAALAARGHHGLPALVPGLVHARVATALLAAGYRSKDELRARSFCLLGCHAGLEVRILRDLGAGWVRGVEQRGDVVAEAVAAGLVTADAVWVGNYWDLLARGALPLCDEMLVLAPERLPLGQLWEAAGPTIREGGHLVVVATRADAEAVPAEAVSGPALEGTMRWHVLERSRDDLGHRQNLSAEA